MQRKISSKFDRAMTRWPERWQQNKVKTTQTLPFRQNNSSTIKCRAPYVANLGYAPKVFSSLNLNFILELGPESQKDEITKLNRRERQCLQFWLHWEQGKWRHCHMTFVLSITTPSGGHILLFTFSHQLSSRSHKSQWKLVCSTPLLARRHGTWNSLSESPLSTQNFLWRLMKTQHRSWKDEEDPSEIQICKKKKVLKEMTISCWCDGC